MGKSKRRMTIDEGRAYCNKPLHRTSYSSIVIRTSLLYVVFHLPHTGGADAGAEAAADTEVFIDYIFK